jgi:hypothetical protein
MTPEQERLIVRLLADVISELKKIRKAIEDSDRAR